MPATATKVLNHQQVLDRVKRIAWQLYETHADEKHLILAGIAESGYQLAELLSETLAEISDLNTDLIRIVVNKKDPLHDNPDFQSDIDLKEKCVVVVDDVLNSGATLIYGVRYFLDYPVKQIKTVVLVDRNHKSFPVKADYKGLSLSTNIMEHVEVNLAKEPYSAMVY